MPGIDDVAFVTPSWAPDAELCTALNRSILALTDDVVHHVIVDRADLPAFAHLRNDRTRLVAKESVMPGHIARVPRTRFWASSWAPRPLSGWLVQQIAKLASVDAVDARTLVVVDSDTAFVRPPDLAAFRRDGRSRCYAAPAAITPAMADHLVWYRQACALLGVEPGAPPVPDYICSLVTWDSDLVRGMLRRVEEVSGRPWHVALARARRVSEFLLYGVYVDRVLGDEAPVWHDDDDLVLTWWDFTPVQAADVERFTGGFGERDLAVLVSSHSGTEASVLSEIRHRLSDGRVE